MTIMLSHQGTASTKTWMSHGTSANAKIEPLTSMRMNTLKRCATETRPSAIDRTTKKRIRREKSVIGFCISGWCLSNSPPHAVIISLPLVTFLQLNPMRIASPNAISTTYATGIENEPQTTNGVTMLTIRRRQISSRVSRAPFHGTRQLQMYPAFLRICSK